MLLGICHTTFWPFTCSKLFVLESMSKFTNDFIKYKQIFPIQECCTCPYGNQYFAEYAESIPGDSTTAFAQVRHYYTVIIILLFHGYQAAKDNKVYLVAGSLPEREGDKIYNTSVTFSPDGALVAKHRKVYINYCRLCSTFTEIGSFVWHWYSGEDQVSRIRNTFTWKCSYHLFNTWLAQYPHDMINADFL